MEVILLLIAVFSSAQHPYECCNSTFYFLTATIGSCEMSNIKSQITLRLNKLPQTRGQINYLPCHRILPVGAASPVWMTITQKQDNFDPWNNKVWNMNGGPIFIMLGGEWTIDESWLQSGQMYDMAKIHKACMFYTEHRYYGESYPTSDLKTSSLRFLTTDQALADVANFITIIKLYNTTLYESKVVVFGCSYAGSLAVWMRLLYPDLVHAAVSSSAPLLAVVDFPEYTSIEQRILGQSCASVVTRGVEEALRLLSEGNSIKIQKDFNFCWPFDIQNKQDIEYFFVTLSLDISSSMQTTNSSNVSTLCNALENPSTLSDYDRLTTYLRKNESCRENYTNYMRYMTNTSLYSGNDRQWMYQTCTQFGFFKTSWTNTSLYGHTIPVDVYSRWCLDFFGPRFTPAVTATGVAATNAKYGALDPQVTRVISVHGTVDPWHVLGLPSSMNSQRPVLVVPGASHCSDITPLPLSESEEIRDAKLTVRKFVAEWLRQPC